MRLPPPYLFYQVINGILSILACIVVTFAAYAISAGSDNNINKQLGTLVPKGVFVGTLIFGIALLVIALLGLCSTSCDSKAGLALYIFIVTAIFVGECVITFYLINKYNIIKDAQVQKWSDENLGPAAKEVWTQITTEAAKDPATWVGTQDVFKCCGYDNPDLVDPVQNPERHIQAIALETGAVCSEPRATRVYCKDSMLALAKKHDLYVMVTSGVLALCQFLCIIAASRLACCVSPDDGGHAGEAWSSTNKGQPHVQQYQMGDITGTAPREDGRSLSYA